MSFAGTPGGGVPPPGSMFTSEMLAQKVRAGGAVERARVTAGAHLSGQRFVPRSSLHLTAVADRGPSSRRAGPRARHQLCRPLQAAEKQRELKDRLREFFEEKGELPGVLRDDFLCRLPPLPPPFA